MKTPARKIGIKLAALTALMAPLALSETAPADTSAEPKIRLVQGYGYGRGNSGFNPSDPYWYQNRRLEQPWEKINPGRRQEQPKPRVYYQKQQPQQYQQRCRLVNTDDGMRRICDD